MKRVAQWVLAATIPIAIGLQIAKANLVVEFIFACLAVIPLAAWIGISTEQLAQRMGSTYGALFNATFGNFAELVIALFAVRAGLDSVVRASLSGSILGNLLFVAGFSALAGGWGRDTLRFNALSAESQAGQMILAVAAMLVPALFFRAVQEVHQAQLIHPVSVGTSVVLMLTYILGLWFAFITHRKQMSGAPVEHHDPEKLWSVPRAVALLLVSSGLMAAVAEELVHAVGEAGRSWGLNQVFLGFIVLAIVGNAAEHSTAVMLAVKGDIDTALNISMQSSVQIALFVTPLIVFLSYPIGHPLDLLFTPFELLAVGLGVSIFAYLVMDGETNWYEGVQLLAVYAIIAVALYFLPAGAAPAFGR